MPKKVGKGEEASVLSLPDPMPPENDFTNDMK